LKKKTLVLGASPHIYRYSNFAVQKLIAEGHPVIALGIRKGRINDVIIQHGMPIIEDVNTITIYLNTENQREYFEYILALKPERLIFNPGAENPKLAHIARKKSIQVLNACTLVMLSTFSY
jgi:predicted CoA-binding protein